MVYLIKLYQKFVSPLKSTPSCRFHPTCSTYAVKAYQRHGFVTGTFLTVWRLLRCNPFNKGGLDPVPEKNWHIQRRKIDEIK